jgi:hypothetical protein
MNEISGSKTPTILITTTGINWVFVYRFYLLELFFRLARSDLGKFE